LRAGAAGLAFLAYDQKAEQIAREAGFDLSLIAYNLSLTPEERALQHAQRWSSH